MTRPLALTAMPSSPTGSLRVVASAVALVAPAAFIAWPVVTVLVQGLAEPGAWPLGLALDSLLIALASTLAALVPATAIAVALGRVPVGGQRLLQRTFGLAVSIPTFIAPLGLASLAGALAVPRGVAALVIGQALAFLPVAVALLVRGLRAVPIELEQAAEVLGASRGTILRRVTLALVGPRLLRAALVVLGLCLGDVVTPWLLAGPHRVLATAIVESGGAAPVALVLALLTAAVALGARSWMEAGQARAEWPGQRRPDRPVPALTRVGLGAIAWTLAAVMVASWLVVPVRSIGHWTVMADGAVRGALAHSVLLGGGAAVIGTVLALVTGWIVERRRGAAAGAVELLLRLPVAVPGLVAGVGYALALHVGPGALAPVVLLASVLVVACWELPATSRVARERLAHVDHSIEEAALSLGAGGGTTLSRILLPALAPAAGWVFAQVFAAGLAAVGTVILLTGPSFGLGAVTMLTLAAAGATGAACAVATVLLALAGGALWLGRRFSGR